MRFLHTGDLHIGKTICDFSMVDDQRHILNQIVDIAVREKVNAVIIAGDVYDRAIPPADAVVVLNDFLTKLVEHGLKVLLISGNHDSPERIGFADRMLEESGIYIAGECDDGWKRVILQDIEGETEFILLPFAKPSAAAAKTNGEAVEKRLSGIKREQDRRSVLVTHYFVTNQGKEPEISDAETTIHVGGLDNVEVSLFAEFDYVALGHIHRQQQIGERSVYYAGAPLQYSFSESGRTKYVTLVELPKGRAAEVTLVPLTPRRQMRRIKGKLKELVQETVVMGANNEDYIQAILTDEEALIDPIGSLRAVYPNVMQIQLFKNNDICQEEYVSRRTECRKEIPELFSDFYEMIRGNKPDEERMQAIVEAAKAAGGEEM